MSKIIDKINELAKEYPDATVKFIVSEETSFHDYNALYIDECDCEVYYDELTEYGDKLLDLDDLCDAIADDIWENHRDLNDNEFEGLVEDMADKYTFEKYIIVRVGR